MTKSLPSPITRMSQAMIVLGICAALIVAFVNLRDKPFIQLIEGKLLDWRFVLRGPIATDPAIELVLIEKIPNGAKGMPVSSADLAKGIEAIATGGAKIVVLGPNLLPMKVSGAAADATGERDLAADLARLDNVVIPYVFSMTPSSNSRSALPVAIQKTAYSVFRKRESPSVKRPGEAGGYLAPSLDLLQNALPGHIIQEQQRTLTRQYAYPVIGYGGSYYPSLAMQAYRRWVDLPMKSIEVNFGESLTIGSLYLPTDNQMRLAVNYHGPGGSYKRTRFSDLLDGSLPADNFKDKLVLVGLAASVTPDNVSTPFDPAMSEVEYLANVIDNINRMNPLVRSQQVIVLDILLLALTGLFFALVAAARSIWVVLTLAVIAMVLFVAGNIQVFILFNLWLGLSFPLLAMILCTAVLMAAKHVSKRRRAALTEAEAAEEAQFTTPWTFDRVAKVVDEETPSLEAGEDESDPEIEPDEKGEASLRLNADEDGIETQEEPLQDESAATREDKIEEAEEMSEGPLADNVSPFPSPKPKPKPKPKPSPIEPSPLPVPPPKPSSQSLPEGPKPADLPVPAQKPKKPASLAPMMDTSARGEKVSLTTTEGMVKSPAANNEFEVAVLYINMAGFMALAKSFGPTRSAQFLHALFQLIEKTVVKHGGFLEQFGEKDVMAIFGLPDESSEDASNGLRAARELASVLSDWGEQQELPAGKSADFCICADFGPVKAHLDGEGEDARVSVSGYTIGLASKLDKTVAAKNADVVVSEKLMTKVSETDLTGQLKDGFTEQPMQQIPGAAETIGLWRGEFGAS